MIRLIKALVLPGLAVAGMVLAGAIVIGTGRATPPAQPVSEPGASPFKSYVSGSGLTENAGPHDWHRRLLVRRGDGGGGDAGAARRKDTVLFRLDDRTERSTRDQRRQSCCRHGPR